MGEITDILNLRSKKELIFYIDYQEMIIDEFEKRGLEHKELDEEYQLLLSRYRELFGERKLTT